MFNAITKTLTVVALGAAAVLGGCGNADKDGAAQLLAQSETAVAQSRYTDALALLDTLNARYPKQTEFRREALGVRAKAMEGIALDSISAGDAALAEATLRVENLRPGFRHVDSSVGLEGYFLPKGVDEKVLGGNAVQGRVTDKGYFYLVANVQRSIGLRSVALVDGSERVETASLDPARVVKVGGAETASFSPEDIAALGPWLEDHSGASKAVLQGTKGNVTIKLDGKLRKELLDCYNFACALQAQRLASVHREKYERMLATARDQMSNLIQAPDNAQ